MATNKKKKWKRKKKSRIGWYILGAIAGYAVVAYVGFAIYFTKHFCFNATLNGVNVSGYSEDKVRQMWEDEISSYTLNIKGRDGSVDKITSKDVDLKLEWDDTVASIIKDQHSIFWITKYFSPDEFECDTIASYNKEKFDSVVSKLSCMSDEMQKMPENAKMSEYSDSEGFTIVEAVDGTAIDTDKFKDGLDQALHELRNEYSIVDDGGYIQPEIISSDERLVKAVDKMNKYAKAKITYEVGEDTFVLDGSTFGDWFKFKGDDMKVVLDKSKVEDYVNDLAKKYNTCYSAKKLETSYGKTVTIDNSRYGWKVDTETEKSQIIKELKAGKEVTRDLNYLMTANSHGKNDYGDSYVEINLTAQHLFLYKDGKLVMESDFVSGNVSRNNATPTGAFGVTYTEKNAVLRGDNYETPVSFWMPFNGNVGMHDATWRGRFGGTLYKYSGSHGCVNLPYSSAEKIFSVVGKNYPVLVYELPGTEQTSGNRNNSSSNSNNDNNNSNNSDNNSNNDNSGDSTSKPAQNNDKPQDNSDGGSGEATDDVEN